MTTLPLIQAIATALGWYDANVWPFIVLEHEGTLDLTSSRDRAVFVAAAEGALTEGPQNLYGITVLENLHLIPYRGGNGHYAYLLLTVRPEVRLAALRKVLVND